MKPSRHRILAWLLAGLFGLVYGVGEGWHLVPGNGHLVELPGGCLWIGVARPQPPPSSDDGPAGVRPARGPGAPLVDKADCPICRLIAEGRNVVSACFAPLPPVARYVAVGSPCLFCAPALVPFDARAPPRA